MLITMVMVSFMMMVMVFMGDRVPPSGQVGGGGIGTDEESVASAATMMMTMTDGDSERRPAGTVMTLIRNYYDDIGILLRLHRALYVPGGQVSDNRTHRKEYRNVNVHGSLSEWRVIPEFALADEREFARRTRPALANLSHHMSAPVANSGFQTAMSILSHLYFAPIIGRLIRANVPDLLDAGPVHSEQLAKQAGLHPLSTVRSLRALTALGVFRELAPGTFGNSEASSLFRDGGGLRNWALFATSEPCLKSAIALEHSLETGQAAYDHALGQKVWEYLRDHPEENEAFNRGLAEIRSDEQAAIAAAYDWAGVRSVVDVGAGAGALLAAVVGTNPGVRGILFDRPDVLPDAEHLLKTRGVRERCELVGGSFFEPIQVKGDVWILSQVLHDWPDAECRTILKRCRERMSSGDRLLVVEMVPVPGQPDAQIALLDVMMMMFFGEARQRTEAEYNQLFSATGFGPARVMATGTAFSVLEAKPS